jgi:hypothetical protein
VPIDTDKIDETVLALLHLTLHDRARAWKGHDWEALNRLHRKGMIGDPVGKAKSVVLTDQGLAESERLFRKLFERRSLDVLPLAGSGRPAPPSWRGLLTWKSRESASTTKLYAKSVA